MRAPDLHRTTARCGVRLVDLPPELLIAICVFLDCRMVVWCRTVCRQFRDAIDSSLELQYCIELDQDGMIDGSFSSLSQTRGGDGRDTATTTTTTAMTTRTTAAATTTTTRLPRQLATYERLARLRQLRHAWLTLNWSHVMTVPMPGPCSAYELVGGVFCKTQPGSGWNGVGHENGLNDQDDTVTGLGSRAMRATWLPGWQGSAGDRNRDRDRDEVGVNVGVGRTIVRDDLGIPTRDFAIDPSQDLMVLLKGDDGIGMPLVAAFPGVLELHLRTISTNRAHPEAKEPVLCLQVWYPITSVFVQIVDDVVGMMYCIDPSRPRITIWHWKTGDLVVDRGSGHLPAGTWDLSFISNRAIMVTTGTGGGTLELFAFTYDRAREEDRCGARPLPSYDTPTSTLVHVASLQLPSVYPSVRLLSLGTHTGPFLATCPPDKLFVASNEERIHVITIQYVHLQTLDGPRTRPRVCVFVHNRTLEGYVRRGLKEGVAIPVPWSEWGRTRTRMVPCTGSFQWLRYVHGQRVVLLQPGSEAGRSTLQVLDFNMRSACCGASSSWSAEVGGNDDDNAGDDDRGATPTLGLAQRKKATGAGAGVGAVVDYPTRIGMSNIFVDAVESGLPYREVLRDVRGDYSGVMIDEERLVGLKYPAFLTGDMKEIDVFTM